MKLQKVAIVLGISACLLGTQVQGTFGLEDGQAVSVETESAEELDDQVQLQEEIPEYEPETVAVEEAVSEETPAAPPGIDETVVPAEEPAITPAETAGGEEQGGSESGQPQTGDSTMGENESSTGDESQDGSSESGQGESSETGTPAEDGQDKESEEETQEEQDKTGESESGDKESDKESEKESDKESGKEESGGKVTGKKDSDKKKPEKPSGKSGKSGKVQTGEPERMTGTEGGKGETGEPQTPAEAEEDDSSIGLALEGEMPGTDKMNLLSGYNYYVSNEFHTSGLLLDDREKVKYNVALPIKGIPSFITQEMIIGALKCQDETGYPASVTIAQIIQESGYGSYGPGGDSGQGLSYLAYQYNNLFGIKGSGPAGSVEMRTGEQAPSGEHYMTTAGFRVYNTYTECLADRTKLLKEVYSDLTAGVKDANTFALRIGRRWATDIDYAKSLIIHMERYDLYRLDDMTLKEFSDMIGTFANPCPGSVITSNFGRRSAPVAGATTFHKGVDLGTGAYNIPTYAAEAGTVTFAGSAGACGNMVVIDHGNGLVTKYEHHDRMFVKEGQKVEKGQQIGLSGTTGCSTGNHLHFQVEENGVAVDPLPYLGIAEP